MGRSAQIPRLDPDTRAAGANTADDTGCGILHVDMDAFYASVEIRRRPELAGRPVIVGGGGNRGVVCSAGYAAREYGVRAAMPVGQARRLCPTATVLPGDMSLYAEVSRAVMAILAEVTPLVEPLSLDEAFLDVSGARRRLGSPAVVAALIRERIAEAQHLTCSVGVAPTKFVAKVASARAKPDGLLVVSRAGVLDFLHPLPVTALWGVGPTTERRLRSAGILTIADLAAVALPTLRATVGRAAAEQLHALALGHDPRPVDPHCPDRSVGAEETFSVDIDDRDAIHRELLRLATRTAGRLRKHRQAARTVAIKVRFADFTTVARSRTLDRPTDVSHEIYTVSRELFDALRDQDGRSEAVRLVGVRGEGVITNDGRAEQLMLGEADHGWAEADRATDAATSRFGVGAVRPASLVSAKPIRLSQLPAKTYPGR